MTMRLAPVLLLVACTTASSDVPPRPDVLAPQPVACVAPVVPQFVPLPEKATAIDARSDHVCVLLASGRVSCWGNNEFQQAGVDARSPATVPHDIGLERVTQISLGDATGCARFANGTTTCWGRKPSWNSDLPQSRAARPPADLAVTAVDAGSDHTCALVKGEVRCWGELYGFSAFKAPRVPGVAGATALSTGYDADCAIAGGRVSCWGRPYRWDCPKECEDQKQKPSAIRLDGISDAVALDLGSFDGCAIRKTGEVACWGSVNGSGKDGYGVRPIGVRGARAIALGPHHACAALASGEVTCWGEGYRGDRGDGRTDEDGQTPTTVTGITNAVGVASGLGFSCALERDGRVACWGVNEHGQLGFTTPTESTVPLDTCALDRVTQLAAAYGRTCALRADGTVACWGTGWGWKNHNAVPAIVAGLSGVVEIAGNEQGICARTRAGAVTCWPQWYDPIAVPPVPVTQMSNGGLGACGVAKDGTVYCGAAAVSDVPKGVKVVSGEKYGCVLGTDAKVTCWGEGTILQPPAICRGDVCDRAPVDRSPRRAPLARVTDISTAHGDLCARTADGKVRCVSPLGVTSLSEQTPVAKDHAWTVPPDYTQVVKGRDHTCGLRANGLVRCWGDNTFGQLGTGQMGLVPAPAR